jgi:hypothetical protein
MSRAADFTFEISVRCDIRNCEGRNLSSASGPVQDGVEQIQSGTTFTFNVKRLRAVQATVRATFKFQNKKHRKDERWIPR